MITAQIESFTETLAELKPLLPVHWEDLALDKDKVPLDPQYDIYFARELQGQLLFVTLRKSGYLIGYFIGFIAPALHYKTCLTCTMDIYYILPAYRNGARAIKLFRAVFKELKRRGVQKAHFGSKLHKDTGRLFEAFGMTPIETYYSKWIGD